MWETIITSVVTVITVVIGVVITVRENKKGNFASGYMEQRTEEIKKRNASLKEIMVLTSPDIILLMTPDERKELIGKMFRIKIDAEGLYLFGGYQETEILKIISELFSQTIIYVDKTSAEEKSKQNELRRKLFVYAASYELADWEMIKKMSSGNIDPYKHWDKTFNEIKKDLENNMENYNL